MARETGRQPLWTSLGAPPVGGADRVDVGQLKFRQMHVSVLLLYVDYRGEHPNHSVIYPLPAPVAVGVKRTGGYVAGLET